MNNISNYNCPFVEWKEVDYDVFSGHSSYEPVCTIECNEGKHCYKYYSKYCNFYNEFLIK